MSASQLEQQTRDPGVTLRGRNSETGQGQDVETIGGAAKTAQVANQPGEITSLWAKQAGLILEPLVWTQSSAGQIITGDCAVLGFRVLAGTSPTLLLYDGTSATGTTKVFDGGGALTVNQFYPILGAPGGSPAALARCVGGLWGVPGGTSPSFLFWVLRSQPA